MKGRRVLASLLLVLSTRGLAQGATACSEPNRAEECGAQAMRQAEAALGDVTARLHQRLAATVGEPYAKRMEALQREWRAFADRQCEHSRGVYGQGSEGRLNAMSCRELLYRDRAEELKRIYADALEPR
jgi:uncharacterized protein YecT (DUF1311 family)